MNDGEQGNLSGKICIVTGATSGVGLATARALARLGGQVVGVGRDEARNQSVCRAVAQETEAIGAPYPRYETADLSSMREVSALAERLSASLSRVDVLVNCAGIYTAHRTLTEEGLEMQFAVNYLAPFHLTTSLLPLLRSASAARVITVSSDSHYYGRIHWRDPSLGRFYLGLWAYEQSKLADVLFCYELARRLGPGSPISVYAADPGLVNTEMGQKHGTNVSSLFWSIRRHHGTSPDVPARAIVFLAASEEAAGRTGLYCKDCVPKRSSRRSYDKESAARLWEESARMVAQALASTSRMN